MQAIGPTSTLLLLLRNLWG